jgi:Polysaccharide biosynthesis enzyme WcbI
LRGFKNPRRTAMNRQGLGVAGLHRRDEDMDGVVFDVSSDLPEGRARSRRIGFIGNCQAELLEKAFRRTAPASQFASFYHYFDVSEVHREAAGADLADCDVLLMQDIQDLEFYPLREAIPTAARIVQFPFLRFASLWPYDDFNGLRDTAARAQDDPSRHTTTYYDGVLGRLRRSTPDPQRRFEVYRAGEAVGMVDPLRVHDFETRRLEALDARFGCSIGRFILDEFRNTQLFYTINHPCGALLAMVLDYIFRAIGAELLAQPDGALDELRSTEVPVHPLVAHRLSLGWADETTLYNDKGRRTTWEGFVRGYIARYG